MPISRRHFLQFSAYAALSQPFITFAKTNAPLANKNLILGGGRFADSREDKFREVLAIVDIDQESTSLLNVDFYPHGIHLDRKTPSRLALFEKKGPGACEVDLVTRSVTRTITTDKRRHFYGHGAYSADSKYLYCTESYLDSLQGIIAIRDSKTHEYLGEFPTYGKEPHECKLIDDGKTMVVTNGGGFLGDVAPSVTYIDIASQQLIEKVELTNPKIGSGHIAIGKDGSLVVVSPARTGSMEGALGGVSIRPYGKTIQSIGTPEQVTTRMKGEALSVAIDQKNYVAAVTHPGGDMVTFWSTKNRELLNIIELPQPRGVSLTSDDDFFIISYDAKRPKILKVPTSNLSKDKASIIDNTFISGSHIYNWSRGLTELSYPGPLV